MNRKRLLEVTEDKFTKFLSSTPTVRNVLRDRVWKQISSSKNCFPTIWADTFSNHTNFSPRICLNGSRDLFYGYLRNSVAKNIFLLKQEYIGWNKNILVDKLWNLLNFKIMTLNLLIYIDFKLISWFVFIKMKHLNKCYNKTI